MAGKSEPKNAAVDSIRRMMLDLDKRLEELEEELQNLKEFISDVNYCLTLAITSNGAVIATFAASSSRLAYLTSYLLSLLSMKALLKKPANAKIFRKPLQDFLKDYAPKIIHGIDMISSSPLSECPGKLEKHDHESAEVTKMFAKNIQKTIVNIARLTLTNLLELYGSLARFIPEFKDPEIFLQDIINYGRPELLKYIDTKEMLRIYGDEGVYLLKNYRKETGQIPP